MKLSIVLSAIDWFDGGASTWQGTPALGVRFIVGTRPFDKGLHLDIAQKLKRSSNLPIALDFR